MILDELLEDIRRRTRVSKTLLAYSLSQRADCTGPVGNHIRDVALDDRASREARAFGCKHTCTDSTC